MNEELWSSVGRAGGLVAWAMVTLSVIWGLALSTRLAGKKASPGWLLDLHRFFGSAAVVFTAVHLVGVWFERQVEFDLIDYVVPWASGWQPTARVWGVLSLYLLVAVQLTSVFKKRLPTRLWRRVHMLSFPLFILATMHTLGAGSDAQSPLYRWGSLVAIQMIAFLALARVLLDRRNNRGRRTRSSRHPAGGPAAARTPSSREGRADNPRIQPRSRDRAVTAPR